MSIEPSPERRRLATLGVAVLAALSIAGSALAHPLGNFSVNHWSALRVERGAINLRYVIDLAEIPTFQELQEHGLIAEPGHPRLAPYLARRAETLADGLVLEVDGRRLTLAPRSHEVVFPPGAAGLPTMKITIDYRARLDGGSQRLEYRDGNYAGRAGWKEIVATAGPGIVLVESSAPETDRSRELSDYPTDIRESPPQDLQASVIFAGTDRTPVAAVITPTSGRAGRLAVASPPSTEPEPRTAAPPAASTLRSARSTTPRGAFTELMAGRDLGPSIVLGALLIATGLGALHALEPGHGKTVVAAYLVGSRGTARHALLLGLIVTASHTAGVYLLGAVTLYASRHVVPERLYPWLGVASGVIIAALGFTLFLRRYAGQESHGHHPSAGAQKWPPHSPNHEPNGHDHHDHEHEHGHDHHHGHHHHHVPAGVSLSQLFALGVSGGIVPCPAALVVLLSAVALQRVGFGLLLIVAFSLGLAAVLIALGLLVVHARRLMTRFHGEGRLITRWLPLTSSAIVAVFGITIALQALVSAGIIRVTP
jgi:ABC-type nickel/cobalt efflux system permease component RcnA